MTPLSKELQNVHLKSSPADEALLATPGIDKPAVQAARAAGLSPAFIIGLLLKFGPLFGEALSLILEALHTDPPPVASPEATQSRQVKSQKTAMARAQAVQEAKDEKPKDQRENLDKPSDLNPRPNASEQHSGNPPTGGKPA